MRPLGDRLCSGCGKEYWANQAWQHDKCVVHTPIVHESVVHKPPSGSPQRYKDKEKRRAYKTEWERKKRAQV